MSLNLQKVPLETINRSTSEQTIDLIPDTPTVRLDCVLAGSMTVVGANADGAVFADASERLVTRIRVMKDSFPLVDTDLRGLYQDYIRNVLQAATRDDLTTAEVDGAGTYTFRLPFSIFFNSPYLARPFDTHLPALPVRNSLRMLVQWGATAQSASSDPGTGEMLSAGTDAYTWGVEPTIEVVQVIAPKAGIKPYGVPVFESFDLPTWDGAISNLVGRFDNDRAFSRMILRQTYGATDLLEDGINYITLKAAGQRWLDRVAFATLRDDDQAVHPAIGTETGYLALTFTNGGKLGGAVMPRQHTDLRLEIDADDPTSGSGLIRVYQRQVIGIEGKTVLPPGV